MTAQIAPPIGVPQQLADGITRVIAPNPSPMTYWGTNTYLLGHEDLVVIDPGPAIEDHLNALIAAMGHRSVSHILVTHSHLDHSPLAAPLSAATGAPIYAFGKSEAGRSKVMQELAMTGLVGGGEGIDHDFSPDHILADGEVVETAAGPIQAIHTPGHIGNHLCFSWADALFCGDHVMGWASSLVSPPDGDLGDFLSSCNKLTEANKSAFYPAHGDPITKPAERLEWLIAHRMERSRQILQVLESGPSDAKGLTQKIYHDAPQALWPAAERNVLAHLIYLHQQENIVPLGAMNKDVQFALRSPS